VPDEDEVPPVEVSDVLADEAPTVAVEGSEADAVGSEVLPSPPVSLTTPTASSSPQAAAAARRIGSRDRRTHGR
jgi:hypothetical protein